MNFNLVKYFFNLNLGKIWVISFDFIIKRVIKESYRIFYEYIQYYIVYFYNIFSIQIYFEIVIYNKVNK